jgi:hypothetical protein
MAPSSMKRIRSAVSWAKLISWVTTKIVMPPRASPEGLLDGRPQLAPRAEQGDFDP